MLVVDLFVENAVGSVFLNFTFVVVVLALKDTMSSYMSGCDFFNQRILKRAICAMQWEINRYFAKNNVQNSPTGMIVFILEAIGHFRNRKQKKSSQIYH